MQLTSVQDGNKVLLMLDGDLDYTSRTAFEAEFRRLVEQLRSIDLDCRNVSFVDSSGVASLLSCCEDAEEAGVTVRLLHVSDGILEVLDLLGVKEILPLSAGS